MGGVIVTKREIRLIMLALGAWMVVRAGDLSNGMIDQTQYDQELRMIAKIDAKLEIMLKEAEWNED